MGSSPFARTNLYPRYLQSIAFICLSVLAVYPFFHTYGPVAHLGERYVRNVEVESSSLFRSTTSFRQTDFLFVPLGSDHIHTSSSACRDRCACDKKQISVSYQITFHGALAQLGAHDTGSVGVRGSSPLCSTRQGPGANRAPGLFVILWKPYAIAAGIFFIFEDKQSLEPICATSFLF